jgi:hypothetical protein
MQMATYSLDVCVHMDFPLPAPRHLRLRIHRQLRQCHHRRHIAEGCAAKYICGSRRARCAAGVSGLARPEVVQMGSDLLVRTRVCEKVGIACARIMDFAP